MLGACQAVDSSWPRSRISIRHCRSWRGFRSGLTGWCWRMRATRPLAEKWILRFLDPAIAHDLGKPDDPTAPRRLRG